MKRQYLLLWALLACAFAIFFMYSMADSDVAIGGTSLRRSKLADAVINTRPDTIADAISRQAACLPTDTIAQMEPEPAEPDTLPKTILFIGDSMLEGLYPRLAAYCESTGHTLYAAIWYSSTTEIWGNVNLITEYKEMLHPDYIFICLGANELFIRDIAEKRDPLVKHMLAEIGDTPYLWIGPPNWKPDTGINSLIRANTKAGCFFLSDGMTFERKSDGAHPTPASAIEWMDSIVRWMPGNCAYPLRLEEPQKKTASAKKVYVHSPGPDPHPKK